MSDLMNTNSLQQQQRLSPVATAGHLHKLTLGLLISFSTSFHLVFSNVISSLSCLSVYFHHLSSLHIYLHQSGAAALKSVSDLSFHGLSALQLEIGVLSASVILSPCFCHSI